MFINCIAVQGALNTLASMLGYLLVYKSVLGNQVQQLQLKSFSLQLGNEKANWGEKNMIFSLVLTGTSR